MCRLDRAIVAPTGPRDDRRNGRADDFSYVYTKQSLLRQSARRSAECSHEAIVVQTVAPTVTPTVAPTHNNLSIKKYSRLVTSRATL